LALGMRIRAGCFLWGLLLVGCGPARPSAEVVKRDLSTAVPLQSTPAQVLTYLTRQRIEHTEYNRDARQGNLIHAVVRDRSRWNIVKTDCSITFHFDDRDRLVAFDVREWLTGP